MTREKWHSIVSDTEEQFTVLEKQVYAYNEDTLEWFGKGEIMITDYAELPRQVDRIVFEGPTGKMKFEYSVQPRFLREKTQYSKRLAGEVLVEKIYDTNECSHTFRVYRTRGDDWEEVVS